MRKTCAIHYLKMLTTSCVLLNCEIVRRHPVEFLPCLRRTIFLVFLLLSKRKLRCPNRQGLANPPTAILRFFLVNIAESIDQYCTLVNYLIGMAKRTFVDGIDICFPDSKIIFYLFCINYFIEAIFSWINFFLDQFFPK